MSCGRSATAVQAATAAAINKAMNLPNKLTILRIALVPVFILFAILAQTSSSGHCYLIAGIVFAAASFTDWLDGYIARKKNIVTDFGKFADPLADKILTTVALLYMMAAGICDPLVLCIILAREFAVAGVRMVAAGAKNGKVIAANGWGKVKTVLQMLTIVFYYFGRAVSDAAVIGTITSVLCWVVAAVTLFSGVIYLHQNRRFIKNFK